MAKWTRGQKTACYTYQSEPLVLLSLVTPHTLTFLVTGVLKTSQCLGCQCHISWLAQGSWAGVAKPPAVHAEFFFLVWLWSVNPRGQPHGHRSSGADNHMVSGRESACVLPGTQIMCPFAQSRTQTQETVLPTLRLGLPTSMNCNHGNPTDTPTGPLIWTIPH